MSRTFFLSIALVSLPLLGGCALDASDESTGEAAQAASYCIQIWDPVCGKDGKTYANACEAGGQGKIAYAGECIDPCAAVLCITGTECIVRGKKPVCVAVETDPCATVRCMAGTTCVIQGGAAVCEAATCDPSACGPAPMMPTTLCPDGVNVSGPTGVCLDNGDGTCGWEIASCP